MNARTRNRLQSRDAAYQRIHAWLRDNPQAHTVAAIAAATHDTGDAHRTGIALSQMARCAYVVRTGTPKTGWRYRVGDVSPRTWRETRAVTTQQPATKTSSRAPSLDQQRERIAADIAAFEARGGRIQRLGVTQLFRQSRAAND